MKRLSIVIAALMLSSCSQKIDGSSHKSYKVSVEKITHSMNATDAMNFVVDAATACPLTLQAGQPTFVDDSCLPLLDGKTVEEIQTMARVNRLKLDLKTAEDQLEIYKGRYASFPDASEKQKRYASEIEEIKSRIDELQ